MQSENGILVDVGQVHEVVDRADVFVIGFANLAERLLIDTRRNEKAGPMVRVVEPLGSVQERLFWLGKERGGFGMPQAFTFFSWPHSLGYLRESGIWERVRERIDASNDRDTSTQCEKAMAVLAGLERAALVAAARGDNYVTLWPPEPVERR